MKCAVNLEPRLSDATEDDIPLVSRHGRHLGTIADRGSSPRQLYLGDSTIMRLLSSLATFAVRYVLLCTSPVAVRLR
jgi:hypothetical protein